MDDYSLLDIIQYLDYNSLLELSFTCTRLWSLVQKSQTKIHARIPSVPTPRIDINGRITKLILNQLRQASYMLKHKINKLSIDVTAIAIAKWPNIKTEFQIFLELTRFNYKQFESLTFKGFALECILLNEVLEIFSNVKNLSFTFRHHIHVYEDQLQKILSAAKQIRTLELQRLHGLSGYCLRFIPDNQLEVLKFKNISLTKINTLPLFLEKQQELHSFTLSANVQIIEVSTDSPRILPILFILSKLPKLKTLKIFIPEDFDFF